MNNKAQNTQDQVEVKFNGWSSFVAMTMVSAVGLFCFVQGASALAFAY